MFSSFPSPVPFFLTHKIFSLSKYIVWNLFADPNTVVLSSTGLAAEYWGAWMGEYVKTGEYQGRPYYKQRGTLGDWDVVLYYSGTYWLVSPSLGGSSMWGLLNYQKNALPPTNQWHFSAGGQWSNRDTSLRLEFSSLTVCQTVRVSGSGDVLNHQSYSLGEYRFASLHLNGLIIMFVHTLG